MMWNDKPYHSLDYELKQRFGEKVWRLSLNAGMSCPNRDGRIGTMGCSFCSEGGSGDFAGEAAQTITQQLTAQAALLAGKRNAGKFIAYFQAYTNTYAPVEYLRRVYFEAAAFPGVVGISIATRPDCLPPEVLSLLGELNEHLPVWVELGLQTMHEESAALFRRGYTLPMYEEAVRALRELGIEVITHAILGLPGETTGQILQTMDYLSSQDIQGVKLQLLHVLKNTDLGRQYLSEPFHILTREEYIDLVIRCLEHLRRDIVIHRLTGDGPADLLIAPLWSQRKRDVLNGLHRELKVRQTWQGRLVTANGKTPD